jgi:uncharacterized protein
MPFKISDINMSEKILIASIKSIFSLPADKITFIWHGGEPLSAGINFFNSAMKFQNQYKSKNITFRNNIQTNATLINSEWINFFKLHNFNIGISIDGPEEIHNLHRVFPNGKGSFSNVLSGIHLVQENKLDFGCLAVITNNSTKKAEDIFNFFINEKILSFDVLPCIDFIDDKNYAISSLNYANFLIELFDLWFNNDDPRIKIRFFDNILLSMLGGKVLLCKFSGNCSNFFTIKENGDIFPCDKFIGNPELKLGNICEDNLDDILKSNNFKYFSFDVGLISIACQKCKWLSLCNGGCSYNRYAKRKLFTDLNTFCKANKMVFTHIEKVLQNSTNKFFNKEYPFTLAFQSNKNKYD